MEYILLFCVISILVIAALVVVQAYLKNFSSIGLRSTTRDLAVLLQKYPTDEIYWKDLKSLPVPTTKERVNYSTSSLKQLVIARDGQNLIVAAAKSDTFGMALWNTGTVVGYAGKSKFEIIKTRLGKSCYLDGKYLGYIPRVFRLYSYGKTKFLRQYIANSSGQKLFTYNSPYIHLGGTSSSSASSFNESVVRPFTTRGNIATNHELVLTAEKDGTTVAEIRFGSTFDSVGIDAELVFAGENIAVEEKQMATLFFICELLSF